MTKGGKFLYVPRFLELGEAVPTKSGEDEVEDEGDEEEAEGDFELGVFDEGEVVEATAEDS